MKNTIKKLLTVILTLLLGTSVLSCFSFAEGAGTPCKVHSWGEWKKSDTQSGHYRVCAECGCREEGECDFCISSVKYSDAGAHTTVSTCPYCGCTKNVTSEHVLDLSKVKYVSATVSERAYTEYYCVDCGFFKIYESDSAHEHIISDFHNANAYTHSMYCAECGQLLQIEQHIKSDWIIDYEPTDHLPGKRHKACMVCGYMTAIEEFSLSDLEAEQEQIQSDDQVDDDVNDSGYWTDCAAAFFAGGTGSNDDPYQISTAEELALFEKLVNQGSVYFNSASYKLTNDIDLSGRLWNPIGKNGYRTEGELPEWAGEGIAAVYLGRLESIYIFKGEFDGNGHTIRNANITCEQDVSCYGFFGTFDGTIKNLTLDGVRISGQFRQNICYYVGCMIGRMDAAVENHTGSISNCRVTNCEISIINYGSLCCGSVFGAVLSTGTYAHTIIRIFDVQSEGIIHATSAAGAAVGGLFGLLQEANVSFCSFTGNILYENGIEDANTRACTVGGLIGTVDGNNSISDCYAYTEISVESHFGENPSVSAAANRQALYCSGSYQNIVCACTYSLNGQKSSVDVGKLYNGSPYYLEYHNIVLIEDQNVYVYRYSLKENMSAEETTVCSVSHDFFADVLHLNDSWIISQGSLPVFQECPKAIVCAHCAESGRQDDFLNREIVHDNAYGCRLVSSCPNYCSICGEYLFTDIVPYIRQHRFSITDCTAPTGTEKGERTLTCKDCGYSVTEETTLLNGHCIGRWSYEIPATYTDEGVRGFYYCSDCGKYLDKDLNEIKTVVIPASGFYDTDKSGGVNISDVTALLDRLAKNEEYDERFDLNKNGILDISDVTALLDYLSAA